MDGLEELTQQLAGKSCLDQEDGEWVAHPRLLQKPGQAPGDAAKVSPRASGAFERVILPQVYFLQNVEVLCL
jgi:hypothetical protein